MNKESQCTKQTLAFLPGFLDSSGKVPPDETHRVRPWHRCPVEEGEDGCLAACSATQDVGAGQELRGLVSPALAEQDTRLQSGGCQGCPVGLGLNGWQPQVLRPRLALFPPSPAAPFFQ